MAAEEGQIIISCHNMAEWNELMEKHSTSSKLLVVQFTASWSGPCRVIAPVLDHLAKRETSVDFVKVEVDEVKDVATKFNVEVMPTFVFFKGGEEVTRIVGAKKDELIKTVKGNTTVTSAA